MKMKQYEIINMSDACTIEAESPEVAAVAVIILSNGSFGLNDEEGETVLPLLAFGGNEALDSWLEERGIESLGAYIDENREVIATALDSVMYGKFIDRLAYNKGIELLEGDSAKLQEWKDHWEDARRTSMSQICKTAWHWARDLRGEVKAS